MSPKLTPILILLLFLTLNPTLHAETNTFGSGLEICTPPLAPVTLDSPTTVGECTQAALQTALDAGGHINFDCGPNPVSIPLSSQLNFNPTVDTVLDGGGLVTLDGQNQTRILHKDWHDPNAVDSVTITVQNIRFINAKAPSDGSTGGHSGGAINVGHPGTRLHVINSTFAHNSTTDITTTDNQGGAIFVSNSYDTLIVGSVFEDNQAGSGGAFGGIATGLLVYNSVFNTNHALDDSTGGIVRGYGGAIHLDGVTNSYNPNSNKRVDLCGNRFEGNTAVRGGGASTVTVSDNKGTLVRYAKSSFIDNEVFGLDGSYGQGGAIYHIEDDHAGGRTEQNLQISDSTFHGNKAGRQGGAIWLYLLGFGKVSNSTFEGNTTTAPFNTVGQGGAAAVTLGRIDFTNVTFANNHAAYQGGALHGGGSNNSDRVITLKNTIFYNNTLNEQDLPAETRWQGYHTNRPMTDGGQNIQFPREKPTYNNTVNNNITANPIYQDPLLGPLADNGGPTLTMAPQADSPAIDAGTSGCPAFDQRGEPRVGQCDIGPVEYNPNTPPSFTAPAPDPASLTVATGHRFEYSFTASDAEDDLPTLTAPVLPDWLDFTIALPRTPTDAQGQALGIIFGTPTTADIGQHPVVLRVTDSAGLTAEQAFTVTVEAAVPALSLSKSVANLQQGTGTLPFVDAVAYTLHLENSGTTTATAVVLSDTLPAGLNFGGWLTQNSASFDGQVIQWGPDSLGLGQSVTLAFTASLNVNSGTGSLELNLGQTVVNTATFSSENGGTGMASARFSVGQATPVIYLPLVLR